MLVLDLAEVLVLYCANGPVLVPVLVSESILRSAIANADVSNSEPVLDTGRSLYCANGPVLVLVFTVQMRNNKRAVQAQGLVHVPGWASMTAVRRGRVENPWASEQGAAVNSRAQRGRGRCIARQSQRASCCTSTVVLW